MPGPDYSKYPPCPHCGGQDRSLRNWDCSKCDNTGRKLPQDVLLDPYDPRNKPGLWGSGSYYVIDAKTGNPRAATMREEDGIKDEYARKGAAYAKEMRRKGR